MRKLMILLLGFGLFFILNTAKADSISLLQIHGKAIPLFEQPDTKSKTLTIINDGETIIPFFDQKDWVKVASPKTGEVGWLPKNTLSENSQTLISINSNKNQYVIAQRSGGDSDKNAYQITQYSNTSLINQQQVDKIFKQIQTQQQQMQERFNKLFADTFKSTESLDKTSSPK